MENCEKIFSEENASKSLKHEYVTNENIIIGKLKDKLVMILLNDNPVSRGALLDKLIKQVTRYRTAIVPDRHFPRPATSHKKICCRVKKAL